MKKTLFLLLMSIILCVSCTQSRKDTLLIPAKSSVIAAFDIPSLIKKAQFDSISALHDEELLNTFPLLHALVKNVTNTGIDFSGDLFVFFVLHNNVSYTCATIPLKDQAQTQKLIQNTLSNEFSAEGKQRFYSQEYETWVVAENNQLLVVSHNYSGKKEVSAQFVDYLMNLPQHESIADNENFKTFCKDKTDIGVFISTTPYMETIFGSDFSGMQALHTDLNENDLYKNNYVIADVEFKNKEVEINYSLLPSEALEEYMTSHNFSKDRLANELVQFAHANSLFALFYSIDADKMLAYLQTIPEFTELSQSFATLTKLSLEQLLSLSSGDLMLSLYDVVERDSSGGSVPCAMAVANIKDETAVNELLQQKFADAHVKAEVPYYDLSQNNAIPLFISVYNSSIVLTTDTSTLTAFTNGGFENTMNNDFASSTHDDMNVFVNLDYTTYPKAVQYTVDSFLGKNFASRLPFTSLLISSASASLSAKMTLAMKNNDSNSLHQILQFVQTVNP